MVEELVELRFGRNSDTTPRDVHLRAVDHKHIRCKLIVGVDVGAKIARLAFVDCDHVPLLGRVLCEGFQDVLEEGEGKSVDVLFIQDELHVTPDQVRSNQIRSLR